MSAVRQMAVALTALAVGSGCLAVAAAGAEPGTKIIKVPAVEAPPAKRATGKPASPDAPPQTRTKAAPEAPAATAPAQPEAACNELGLAVHVTPLTPWKGAALRVLVAAEKPLEGELTLHGPDGAIAVKTSDRRGGPPYFWLAEVAKPEPGKWQARLARNGASPECATVVRAITVGRNATGGPGAVKDSVWPLRDRWGRANENIYSAWIEKLFDAPLEEQLSWKALHEVLRDPSRNLLFNHLGLNEDGKGMVIRPDCADLPYFLRTYFAFKMGLPFGYSQCTRGAGGQAPRCPLWWNVKKEQPPPAPVAPDAPPDIFAIFGGSAAAKPPPPDKVPTRPPGLVPGFGFYIGTTVANGVHSGNGRTAADDNNTDYYPVPLTEDALRPGTTYADPYGHLLVVTKRLPQTADAAGLFLAVDGQPDGTVARKRFWRGNFLFSDDKALGGPGFKRFRPVVARGGELRRMTNAEIAKDPEYGDFSLDQSKLGIEAFYDRMDDVMSPNPLDPARAMKEAIDALEEQVRTRVGSVENGRKYQVGGGAEATMPDGPAIFETTGAWEDFATPSRDLRLLIAIDVVKGFPDRVLRRPERYAMPAGKSATDVKTDLEATLAAELAARKVSYTRTDGSPWTLTMQDVVGRTQALEMAYNVNDCVELRWGAAEGSDEAATCKRRAPDAQRQKMASYRPWFAERRRPPRP